MVFGKEISQFTVPSQDMHSEDAKVVVGLLNRRLFIALTEIGDSVLLRSWRNAQLVPLFEQDSFQPSLVLPSAEKVGIYTAPLHRKGQIANHKGRPRLIAVSRPHFQA